MNTEDPYFLLYRSVVAKQMETIAGMQATGQLVADFIAKTEGREAADVLREMTNLQKQIHEDLLLDLEARDPELAALLDLRQPESLSDEEGEA
jgi:hypothetical protein